MLNLQAPIFKWVAVIWMIWTIWYTHISLSTENRQLPWCQLCQHWQHRRLSKRQHPVPPATTKLASWQHAVFNEDNTPSQRTSDAIITPLLRQNDATTSFSRNNDVTFAACVRLGYFEHMHPLAAVRRPHEQTHGRTHVLRLLCNLCFFRKSGIRPRIVVPGNPIWTECTYSNVWEVDGVTVTPHAASIATYTRKPALYLFRCQIYATFRFQ